MALPSLMGGGGGRDRGGGVFIEEVLPCTCTGDAYGSVSKPRGAQRSRPTVEGTARGVLIDSRNSSFQSVFRMEIMNKFTSSLDGLFVDSILCGVKSSKLSLNRKVWVRSGEQLLLQLQRVSGPGVAHSLFIHEG